MKSIFTAQNMNKYYFIDASAFIALIYEKDGHHQESIRITKKLSKQDRIGITTDFSLSEAYTVIKLRDGHETAALFDKFISDRKGIVIIEGAKFFEQARKAFLAAKEKKYSFIDCLSFVIMKKKKITHAFTFDKHFEQAGFKIMK